MTDDANLEAVRLLMERRVPFQRFLGLRVAALTSGHARIEVPFREEFVGDPDVVDLHGGVLSSVIDIAGGLAVWGAAGEACARVATINLRVDYQRPARPEAL